MAHFAKIENGAVVKVIVVSNDVLDAEGTFPKSELSGQKFILSLGLGGEWLQTSYNHTFRGNFAGIGFVYDEELDAFITPKPSKDAILDETTFSWIMPEVEEEDEA